MWWRFWEKRPSSVEVIEAICAIFTEEEMQSMMRGDLCGKPDLGLKQDLLKNAHVMKARYPIDKSVEKAEEIVEPIRKELFCSRSYVFINFMTQIFYC